MFNLLNRYIATRVMRGILLAFLIVTSIILLVDFVEGARDIGVDEDLSATTLILLTLYKAPQLIEQTIPFIVLFGVMGALYALNRRSELIVLRAAGLSAWRFLSPALVVTTSLGILWAIAFNPMATASTAAHQAMIDRITGKTKLDLNDTEIWLREGSDAGQTVIHANGSDLLNRSLTDVTFYYFDTDANGETEFQSRIDAESAKLLAVGFWQLTNATESAEGVASETSPALSMPTTISIKELEEGRQNTKLPGFWDIPEEISKVENAGFSSSALRMQYHRLLSLPLTLIAMTFIAAGVSMQLTRQGGTFRLMLFGGAAGFGVFFVNNITNAFGEAGTLPVTLAAWAIPALVLCLGLANLARIEDG